MENRPNLRIEQGGPAEELLTFEEVMNLSKFRRSFIMREITAKRLNARKFGGKSIRFTVKDYNAWVNSFYEEAG